MPNMSTPEKKEYWVTIPITGTAGFAVEAADEEAAKKAAWDAISAGEKGEISWEYTEQVCRGNVFYGEQNEIEVDEQ